MFAPDEYQLIDFGEGRRLERFGSVVLDRPCPAAERAVKKNCEAWQQADARFEGREAEKGQWTDFHALPERWTIAHGPFRLELKRTEFGHLGVFPEQAENWDWIARVASASQRSKDAGKRLRVLNLFAYTGGSSLAAAAAGTEVAHIDAAQNVVTWARRNAEISGLAEAPVRWIAEDAAKFAVRELKRGRRYDAVILDPPSYGHGPHGEMWQLVKHLPPLLATCRELTADQPSFVLLTCHTPGYDADTLADMLRETFGKRGVCEARPLTIRSAAGGLLPSGVVVRWTASSQSFTDFSPSPSE
jgi:23S rRNA (cytosine1962-C5)-methyltransferase